MAQHTFKELIRLRGYMRLWSTRLAGTMGSQMLMVAVGWQMYELTASAWDLGLVGLYQFLPALLLTLAAGHVADRLHRGRIIAVCYVLQALAATLLIAANLGLGAAKPWASRDLLLGLSVLLGAARAFQMPAQQALTPSLVPPALLPRATAFGSGGNQAAVVAGPALGGLIFVAGATAVYATCAALFIASRSLGGRGNVGCKLTAAVYFSPLSCQISRYSAAKSSKTSLAGANFHFDALCRPGS